MISPYSLAEASRGRGSGKGRSPSFPPIVASHTNVRARFGGVMGEEEELTASERRVLGWITHYLSAGPPGGKRLALL